MGYVTEPTHPSTTKLPKVVDRRGTSREQTMRRLQYISHLFDDAVRVPGTKVTLGWDAVLGLVPVLGDSVTTVVSSYFLWEANRLGVRKRTMFKMLGNVLLDFTVGTIPLVGDLLDVTWRANRRNMKLLQKELDRQHPHD